jgi:hypothetical protein
MQGMSCLFFIATFFQGLSFLIFASNACEESFFEPWYIQSSPDIANAIESVSCTSLGKGGKLGVTACVLYFFCMLIAPAAQPPTPPFAFNQGAAATSAAP